MLQKRTVINSDAMEKGTIFVSTSKHFSSNNVSAANNVSKKKRRHLKLIQNILNVREKSFLLFFFFFASLSLLRFKFFAFINNILMKLFWLALLATNSILVSLALVFPFTLSLSLARNFNLKALGWFSYPLSQFSPQNLIRHFFNTIWP